MSDRAEPQELAEAVYAIRPELDEQLREVINSLSSIADQDCYDSPAWKEDCDCAPCVAKRTIEKVNRVRLPVVRSLRPERLNYAEKVFFDAWVKINTRDSGRGYGLLETILGHVKGQVHPAYVSQRDMDVATTVVQWLGTNCGRSFIWACEKEWKDRHDERADWERVVHATQPWTQYREKPVYQKYADSIAEKVNVSDREKEWIAKEVVKAMLYAKAKAQVEEIEGVL